MYSAQLNYPPLNIEGTGCVGYGTFPNSVTLDSANAVAVFYSQSWYLGVASLPNYAGFLAQQNAYLTASPRIEWPQLVLQ